MSSRTLGLVCCSAGGVEAVRRELIEPMIADGWAVAVTATPTAARWLKECGELAEIERVTGYPLRYEPRLPGEDSPHPPVDSYAVVPATANTVAKLALAIADNQALTQVCEAIGAGRPPVIVFPCINAAHAAHPAWEEHLAVLTKAVSTSSTATTYGRSINHAVHPGASFPGAPSGMQLSRSYAARGNPTEHRWRTIYRLGSG